MYGNYNNYGLNYGNWYSPQQFYPQFNFEGAQANPADAYGIFSKPLSFPSQNTDSLKISNPVKPKEDPNKSLKIGAAIVMTALAAYGLYKGRKFFNGNSSESLAKNIKTGAEEGAKTRVTTSANVTTAPASTTKPSAGSTSSTPPVEAPVVSTQPKTPVKKPETAPAQADDAAQKAKEAQKTAKEAQERIVQETKDQYKNLSNDDLKKKQLEAMDPASKMSVEEYKILKAEIANRFEKTPPVFEGSAVKEHHNLHGHNFSIREDIAKNGKPVITKEYVEKLDEAFDGLKPLEEDYVFFRGRAENPITEVFNKDFVLFDNTKIGDIIVPDAAYPYAAFHRSLAECWGGAGATLGKRTMIQEIRVPKGAKVSCNFEHGGEVIFPRGAEYRLISKSKDPEGVINIVLEYILPKK